MSNVLPQGWEEVLLKDYLDSIIDYRGKTPKKSESGIVTLSAKSVRMGFIEYDNAYYISEETYKSFMTRGFPKKGDVLITTEAPLGCISRLDRDKVGLAQRLITIRGKVNKLDNGYLLYYLQSSFGQHELTSRATGTTVQGIKRSEFEKVKLILAPINEQKRIADILSAFDDKIELNNQMNQTLEDMATTLFANSLLDKKTFTATTLGNLVEIKYGKDHKHLEEGNMPLYGSGGIMRYVNNFLYDKESILIPRKGTLGNLFYIQKPFWTVDTIFYTEINTSKVIPIYLYYALKRFDLANLNVGSAVPSLTKQALNALKLEIPNIVVQKKISDTLTSLHNKILENIEQNQILKQQRDTLLPKLMSGEIRV